ncbi:hypothetical protein PF005_g12046 [Phytophthora fragariae]|uniref:C2H2-type domain-containing protein n=1 Tax=Phytophthora fragariae TaxID=53985 RepID=A0A6A3Z3A9_9STRA|nr:hypothetical protein PF005_g12046 [Phytophthora fragariae]KAE9228549.1 hypothetical protein PF002_g13508 [Phytophthora fragariae]
MFEVHVCKAALREINQLVFKPISRRVYSKKMDEYRRQADIEDLGDAMDFIDGTIKAQVEHANEDWEVRDGAWHALHSYPGGPDQDPHQDFPAFETAKALLKRQLVQESVIVALMNGTKIIVYPGCTGGRASMQKRKKANSTEAVVFDTFRRPKCLEAIDSRGDLTAHKRDEGDYSCGDCGRAFSNRNTRNKHRSRKHLQAVVSDADQVEESDSSNGSRMERGESDEEESSEESAEEESGEGSSQERDDAESEESKESEESDMGIDFGLS